jgi:very-short-patch-repair endonuclease
MILPYNKQLKSVSRELRTNMTDAEICLWAKLRNRQIKGYQFYRQKPAGDYIIDFYSPKAKLAIEVDGGQHFSSDNVEYDKLRDDYLSSIGLRVLRFTNTDVLKNIEGVVTKIEEEIEGVRG